MIAAVLPYFLLGKALPGPGITAVVTIALGITFSILNATAVVGVVRDPTTTVPPY